MPEIIKPEQHELGIKVNGLRHEAGLQALYHWLELQQADLNRRWPTLTGDDLSRAQGAAVNTQRIMTLIKDGPKVKAVQGDK